LNRFGQLAPLLRGQHLADGQHHQRVRLLQPAAGARHQVDLRPHLRLVGLVGLDQGLQLRLFPLQLGAQVDQLEALLLEDLLSLILRCLAVLLLVLLISRLILSGSSGLARVAGARIERIVILDDSPSMELRQGNRTLFSRATAALADYTRKLALRRPGDTLSVILTSMPNQPFLNGQVLGGDRTERVASSLGALQVSGVPARFEQVFLSLLRTVGNEPSVQRELYIVSDFRRHDWLADTRDGGVTKQLAALASRIPNLTLVNVGQPAAADLAITDARFHDPMLTLGVTGQFQLTVVNRGQRDSDGAAGTGATAGAPGRRRGHGRVFAARQRGYARRVAACLPGHADRACGRSASAGGPRGNEHGRPTVQLHRRAAHLHPGGRSR
jgi:hypothetical protein